MTTVASLSQGNRHSVPEGGEHDPVCGMTVEPATAKHRSELAGRTYHFCSSRCRGKFNAEPERYLAPGAPEPAAQSDGGKALWTCPMHPQIVRNEPGSCPICGMALEPMTPIGSEEANPELRDMTRRFWVGVALSVPLVALAMAEDFGVAMLTSRA